MKIRYASRVSELRPVIVAHEQLERSDHKCNTCGGPAVQSGYMREVCYACNPQVEPLLTEYHKLSKVVRYRKERAPALRDYCNIRSHREAKEIGPEFKNAWFRTYFPQTDIQSRAKEAAIMWAREGSMREKYPFFTLSGPAGVGKSHLMAAMWREMAFISTKRRPGSIGRFIRETQFNTRWLASHDSYDREGGFTDPYGDESYSSDLTPPELIASVAETHGVLFIDDVGKVKPTEAWQRAMFEVIYHRHERHLPTVFSTNYNLDTMPQRMDPATNDRFWSGVVVLLDGISHRREQRLMIADDVRHRHRPLKIETGNVQTVTRPTNSTTQTQDGQRGNPACRGQRLFWMSCSVSTLTRVIRRRLKEYNLMKRPRAELKCREEWGRKPLAEWHSRMSGVPIIPFTPPARGRHPWPIVTPGPTSADERQEVPSPHCVSRSRDCPSKTIVQSFQILLALPLSRVTPDRTEAATRW